MTIPYQYLLCGPVLKITCSDSIQEHVDGWRINDVHDHPDGRGRHYILEPNDSKISKYWRKKLGRELAIKFLLKPKNGMYPIFCIGKPFLKTLLVDYILAGFPKSYFLYSHKKGNNHDVDRADRYLYSLCSHLPVSHSLLTYPLPAGDNHKFRSPAEFVPHAAWLIAGMPEGRCGCQYCSPREGETPQTTINAELKAGYEEALDIESKKMARALKKGRRHTPRVQPLEEVYLKTLDER